MGEKVKKVLSTIASVILWIVILIAALFSFVTLATRDPNKVGNIFGYTPMSVKSDSMSPTFNAGDLIIIKKCDPNTLNVGDIITFHTIIQNQYVLNTHRITGIEEQGGYKFFTTKGDNNPIEDSEQVVSGDIVGRYVIRIPFFGKVMDFLQSSIGFLVVILIPMLCFFVYQVYNLIVVATKYKKAAALEEAEEKARIEAEAMVKAQEEARRKYSSASADELKERSADFNTLYNKEETYSENRNHKDDRSISEDETARLKRELEEAKRRLAEAEAAQAAAGTAQREQKEETNG